MALESSFFSKDLLLMPEINRQERLEAEITCMLTFFSNHVFGR